VKEVKFASINTEELIAENAKEVLFAITTTSDIFAYNAMEKACVLINAGNIRVKNAIISFVNYVQYQPNFQLLRV
jgi:hypothetical protein